MESEFNQESLLTRQAVTTTALLLYLALFIYIYVQLVLVLVYGHKRWCFRTAVLYASVVWAVLRVTLFSYSCYLEHIKAHDSIPELSRHVGMLSYTILFSFPLYLQFCILTLLVGYFAQILRISEDRYNRRHWGWTYLIYGSNGLILFINLGSAIIIKEGEDQINLVGKELNTELLLAPKAILYEFPIFVTYIVYLRVVVNGVAFIVMSITLAYLIVKVAQTVEVQLLLETEDMTQEGSYSVGLVLVALYILRTAANVLALVPSIRWLYDTDQVDLLSDSKYGYFMFIMFLFLWEYLPTMASVIFFRVKKPRLTMNYPSLPIIADGPGIEEIMHNSNPLECSMTFHPPSDGSPTLSSDMFNPLLGNSSSRSGSPSHRQPRSFYGSQLVM